MRLGRGEGSTSYRPFADNLPLYWVATANENLSVARRIAMGVEIADLRIGGRVGNRVVATKYKTVRDHIPTLDTPCRRYFLFLRLPVLVGGAFGDILWFPVNLFCSPFASRHRRPLQAAIAMVRHAAATRP